MAFKALNILPDKGYERAKQTATGLRRFCLNLSSDLASGGDSNQVLNVVDSLISFKDNLNAVKAIPGIAGYAQRQESDNAYDVAAEFSTLLALVDAGIGTVVTLFPTDTNGYLLAYKFNPDGTLVPRSFTGAQLSPIRTALGNIASGVS